MPHADRGGARDRKANCIVSAARAVTRAGMDVVSSSGDAGSGICATLSPIGSCQGNGLPSRRSPADASRAGSRFDRCVPSDVFSAERKPLPGCRTSRTESATRPKQMTMKNPSASQDHHADEGSWLGKYRIRCVCGNGAIRFKLRRVRALRPSGRDAAFYWRRPQGSIFSDFDAVSVGVASQTAGFRAAHI